MTTAAPTHHRKIDLQSAADLAYLQRNIHAAARQKIDLHFPPSAAQMDGQGGGDSLRRGVEEIVQTSQRAFPSPQTRKKQNAATTADRGRGEEDLAVLPRLRILSRLRSAPREGNASTNTGSVSFAPQFITRTLTHARQNVTVNGLDLPPPLPFSGLGSRTGEEGEEEGVEYEPYDARLASKLQSLYLALESETMAVAKLRREAPRRAAEGWRARFLEGEGQDGEEDGEKMEVDSEQAAEGDGGLLGDIGLGMGMEGLEERWEGVRGMYAVACDGLVGLKTGMTETVGRCERAGRAAVEVERG